jgi:hypothetical protein
VLPVRKRPSIPLMMTQRMSVAVLVSVGVHGGVQEPMTPRFSGLVAIQMGYSLDFVAVLAEVSHGAASSFAYSDGQLVVPKVDHECSGVVSEFGTG